MQINIALHNSDINKHKNIITPHSISIFSRFYKIFTTSGSEPVHAWQTQRQSVPTNLLSPNRSPRSPADPRRNYAKHLEMFPLFEKCHKRDEMRQKV